MHVQQSKKRKLNMQLEKHFVIKNYTLGFGLAILSFTFTPDFFNNL